MGDTPSRSGADDVVALVDVSQAYVREVNRPHAVGDLLQADRQLLEGFGEEEEFAAAGEEDGAGTGDAFDREVAGILEGREALGIRARRRLVERRRGPAAEGLMRPLLVEEPPKGLEGPVLGGAVRAGRAGGVVLERLVHAFVRAVLLGARWPDALMLDAQPQPPHVELGEPVEPGRGERHAVVRANRARQPVCPKEVL